MVEAPKPRISTRKEPKQTRSRQLVSDVLIAAGRVLAREGAHRFTVARVAEEAGVSVGSFYQYFPNKESILFRLQSDEWKRTSTLLTSILNDRSIEPMQRLRLVVLEFVRSEREEAQMRMALDDAAPFYRDAPEAIEVHKEGARHIASFIHEVLPDAEKEKQMLIAETLTMCLKSAGKRLSELPSSTNDFDVRAEILADMFVAYLNDVKKQKPNVD